MWRRGSSTREQIALGLKARPAASGRTNHCALSGFQWSHLLRHQRAGGSRRCISPLQARATRQVRGGVAGSHRWRPPPPFQGNDVLFRGVFAHDLPRPQYPRLRKRTQSADARCNSISSMLALPYVKAGVSVVARRGVRPWGVVRDFPNLCRGVEQFGLIRF